MKRKVTAVIMIMLLALGTMTRLPAPGQGSQPPRVEARALSSGARE